MNKTTAAQQAKTARSLLSAQGILQRKCACGNHTVAGGECAGCAKNKSGLQRKLAIGSSNDPLEHEADRIANQVLAAPAHPAASGAPPRIQRFAGQSNVHMDAAPASVDRVLASSGRPLDTTLQQDMGQRFGYDFSRVRVHSGAAAEQSARDVNAHAYTVGHNMVFGAGLFAPGTHQGRWLIAHELAHVLRNTQSSGQNTIRRYEAPEHQDFGDKGFRELAEFLKTPEGMKWVEQHKLNPKAAAELDQDPILRGQKIMVGKLQLTPGDVIALMGDFYRSPQALLNASPEEVAELLAAIKSERAGELGGGKANERYQEITAKHRKNEDTFLELAKVNKPHFTPGNRAEWTRLHLEAIREARESQSLQTLKSQRPAVLQEALLIDAAGGHFLTDAFASGHLFNKQELETRIIIYLKNNPPRPANPEMQGYFALSEALGVMPQLVLKNIHDRLNTEGVEVTNKKGMKWRTFGDDRLKNAQETLRIGALAVYLSRRQVMQAQQIGTPDPDPAEVLDLLPDEDSVALVTAKAISYIPAAAADVAGLLFRQRGSVKAGLASTLPPVIGPLVGGVIKANIETIGSPAREKQLLDIQERARTTGVPQVAPQFTVLSF